MEEFKNEIAIFNILVSCFVSIFYICRKYCNKNKHSRYTKEIIDKINDLGIGEFSINQIINEIKKIIPVKLDDVELKNNDLDLKDVKLNISQDL